MRRIAYRRGNSLDVIWRVFIGNMRIENELANPIPICFFRARTEVPTTAYLMNLIHQARRCGNGGGLRG